MRVSVIIPSYNCARFLPDAVESVLAQTCAAHQVIVVDDGSTDDTPLVVARFGPAVEYVRVSNQGAAAARNVGLDRATGDCIAFLDADDAWYERKLEVQTAVLERLPSVQAVCSDFGLARESGEVVCNSYIKAKYRVFRAHRLDWPGMFSASTRLEHTSGPTVFHGDCYRALFLGNFVNTSSMLLRREVVSRAGRFAAGRMTQEDYDYWLRVANAGDLAYVDAPLLFFRQRGGQLTSEGQKVQIAVDTVEVLLRVEHHARRRLGPRIVAERLAERFRELAIAMMSADRKSESRNALKRAQAYNGFSLQGIALHLWLLLPRPVTALALSVARILRRRRNGTAAGRFGRYTA